jgi:hypothetical protein
MRNFHAYGKARFYQEMSKYIKLPGGLDRLVDEVLETLQLDNPNSDVISYTQASTHKHTTVRHTWIYNRTVDIWYSSTILTTWRTFPFRSL